MHFDKKTKIEETFEEHYDSVIIIWRKSNGAHVREHEEIIIWIFKNENYF